MKIRFTLCAGPEGGKSWLCKTNDRIVLPNILLFLRLGLGMYQLLEKTGDETGIDDQTAGIKLPPGFVPTSISFIAEPHSSSTKKHRGILLLTSELNGTVTFVLYQLQAIPMNDSKTRRLAGEPDCRVLAHLASKETFDTDRNFLGSSLSHASIFIAGASFNFNFEQG